MKFKDFMELQGSFGSVRSAGGELGAIRQQIKASQPVKGHGTTIKRLMTSGPKLTKPARPTGLTAPNQPMTIPSIV